MPLPRVSRDHCPCDEATTNVRFAMIRIMLRRLDDEREPVGQVIARAAVELDPPPDAGQHARPRYRGNEALGVVTSVSADHKKSWEG